MCPVGSPLCIWRRVRAVRMQRRTVYITLLAANIARKAPTNPVPRNLKITMAAAVPTSFLPDSNIMWQTRVT